MTVLVIIILVLFLAWEFLEFMSNRDEKEREQRDSENRERSNQAKDKVTAYINKTTDHHYELLSSVLDRSYIGEFMGTAKYNPTKYTIDIFDKDNNYICKVCICNFDKTFKDEISVFNFFRLHPDLVANVYGVGYDCEWNKGKVRHYADIAIQCDGINKPYQYLYSWDEKNQNHTFKEYSIKGINKMLYDGFTIGDFEGTAECDYDNMYDDYAVAIYDEQHICCGYVPRGNKKLFDYINDNGGKVMAYGNIYKEYEEDTLKQFYVGYVYVQNGNIRKNRKQGSTTRKLKTCGLAKAQID